MTDCEERGSPLIIARHTIKVNGQEVYQGEEWAKALSLFMTNVQSLNLVKVEHIVQKQAVPIHHDPRTVKWDDV